MGEPLRLPTMTLADLVADFRSAVRALWETKRRERIGEASALDVRLAERGVVRTYGAVVNVKRVRRA